MKVICKKEEVFRDSMIDLLILKKIEVVFLELRQSIISNACITERQNTLGMRLEEKNVF